MMKKLGLILIVVFFSLMLGACAIPINTVVRPSESGSAVVQPLRAEPFSLVVNAVAVDDEEIANLLNEDLKEEIEKQLDKKCPLSASATQTVEVSVLRSKMVNGMSRFLVGALAGVTKIDIKVIVKSSGRINSDFILHAESSLDQGGGQVIRSLARNVVEILKP